MSLPKLRFLKHFSEGSVGEREAESLLKREVDQLVDDEVKRICKMTTMRL